MNSARRKRRPWEGRRLAVAFVLAACVCGGVSCGGSGATKEPSKEIIIFCAGSLHKPISRVAEKYKAAHASATVLIEPTGSRVAIRKWTDLGRPVDVIAVADSRLIVSEAMPEHADWCLDFTGNRMVVAYTERSLHAAEINENNWFEVLSRPKVQVGRSDENLDPCGYRALMVMQLADLHYPAEKRGRVSIFESIGANIGRNNVRPKALDLQSLLQNIDVMFQLRCERNGLAWQVRTPGDGQFRVRGDDAKLSQVLINLLGNAVKFTDVGGVTLNVTRQAGDVYAFEVIDTGPGIPDDVRDGIFEPFQQAEAGVQKGGTGLGLAISRRILELMGGQLALETEVGKGSRFSFSIPLPPATEEAVVPAEEAWSRVTHLAEGHRVTALIADDILENREVLASVLTEVGVEVAQVENGEQAVEAVRDGSFDIVFLDIRMPALDAFEAAKQIRNALEQNVPRIVAVSASALQHEQQHYLDAVFVDFVPKPVETQRIYACLADLLGVTFDYAEAAAEVTEEPVDLKAVALPDGLMARLRQAAEASNVTELESTLDEVAELGPEAARVAARLRELSQDFRMDEILGILGEMEA